MNSNRQERIVQRLREITYDLSGYSMEDINENSTFLELGFDSLFLTQLGTAYQKEFGVRITFRQLFDELPTIAALGGFIDSNLAPEEPAAPSEPVKPEAVSAPTAEPALPVEHRHPEFDPVSAALTAGLTTNYTGQASAEGIDAIILQQLSLMTEQLRLLRGNPGNLQPAVATVSEAAPSPSIPPAASPAVNAAPVVDTAKAAKPVQPAEPEAPKASRRGYGLGEVSRTGLPALPPRVQQHLDGLIERYTRKTASSKERTQRYRRPLADPRSAAGFNRRWKEMVYPIWVERSLGSKLWDIDGNEYIDILNGFGPNFLGHSPAFVTEAIQEQLRRGVEIGPQTPLAGEVAEMICQLTGMERVTFTCTGSEAVQAAKRIARTYTGRDKIVVFSGDYHGNFDQVLVRGANRKGQLRTFPEAPGIPFQSVNDTYVLEYGTEEALEIIKKHANEIAAVFVEPIQSRRPDFQPHDFLHHLRQITQDSGTILVFDEVITGFRVAPGGAQEYYGIKADLATYGKIVGGGMPIGVLTGRAFIMDTLDGGQWQYGDESFPETGVTFFAGTFVRHPLAIAAAYATLKYLIKEGPALQQRVSDKAARFASQVNEMFKRYSVALEIAQFGSQMYLYSKEQTELVDLLFFHLRYKGVYACEHRPIYMTDAHSEEDLKLLVQAFSEAVEEMVDAGIFGQRPEGYTAVSEQRFPLTAGQQEIWFASQVSDEAACSYNESDTVRLRGPLQVEKLQSAIQDVLARHDALHLRFSSDGSYQLVSGNRRIEVPLVDLSLFSDTERRMQMEALVAREATTAFDLEKGPLVRVTLVRFAAEDHAILFYGNHLVFDGWSSGIIFDEIGKVYSAAKPEEALATLPRTMPFRDYAALESAAEASGDRKAARSHWTAQFNSPPPLLDLPADRPRAPRRSFAGDTVKWKLREDVYRRIKATASKQNTSLFSLLLAAYQVLLSRLSGQNDLVIGVSVAGQAMVDGDGAVVGHGVNLIPLRAQLDGTAPFPELLKSAKKQVLDLYEYYQCTLGDILSDLALARDPSRAPLVEAMFNFSTSTKGLSFAGVEATIGENPRRHVNFDLFANLLEGDGGLTADWDYSTALFDRETVYLWISSFEALLESIADNPATALDELNIISEAERKRILTAWNPVATGYSRDACIHQLFEAQASKTPRSIAVEVATTASETPSKLSYSELEIRANQLANHLRSLGAGRGALVALCLQRSCETLAALLAVLKAGAAYVPLDPDYPQERLAYMLSDSGAKFVIADRASASVLPEGAFCTVVLDRDADSISKASSQRPASDAGPSDTAYVIYTSGSTGQPKGVAVHHRAMVNFLESMAKQPGLTASDGLLAVTTLSFDIAGLELYLPLVVGARCIIADQQTAADGQELLAAIQRTRASVMQATPATWRLLLEAGWDKTTKLKVLCGGESLSPELAAALLERSDDVWNMYGPTETTVWSACDRIQPQDSIISIGRPIANTQIYILDSRCRPVPAGVVGELYIGGDGVAGGYLNRPQLTAERFVPNPFADIPGAKMYRTGDLARFLPDGRIQCLARIDQQVKVRGFRIELGEIESALLRIPTIRQAAVSVWGKNDDDRRLVAHLVLEPTVAMDPARLKGYLQTSLPNYMVPQHFVAVQDLPKTLNGKVDRKALLASAEWAIFDAMPASGIDSHDTDSGNPPSMTPVEERLLGLWRDSLKVQRIGLADNFFDLGGHSLLAARMLSRARREFDVDLSLRDFFAGPTVQELAEAIDARLYVGTASESHIEESEHIEI